MNILHNRFAGLWRQDLSQNVTTKENWKRSCYSSLFFDRLLISSHVHPFTQWVEYVLPRILCEVAPVPSHNVQALHFLHFIECSWKVNGYLLVCLCYQKLRVITKPLWHKAIPQRLHTKDFDPNECLFHMLRNILLETRKSTITAISYRLHSRKYW